jgi:hypothetical protein
MRMRGNPQTLKLGPQPHLDSIVSPRHLSHDFARPFNNRIEVRDAKTMTITSLTLHFFEPGPLALLFSRQKKKNPQPVVSDCRLGFQAGNPMKGPSQAMQWIESTVASRDVC